MKMDATIEEKLNAYAFALERAETLQAQMQELIDKVPVPQEVIDQWNSIKAEFQPMIDVAQEAVQTVKAEIEQEVLALGKTVEGKRYMAVWVKGRETWNGDLLKGYAISHPEINACKKVGEPSVIFRKVK